MPKGYLQWVELLLASRHVFRYSPCLSFQSSSLCPVPVGSKELTLAWTWSSTRRTRKFPDTPRELKKSGSTLLLWRNCWLNTWTGKINESFFNRCSLTYVLMFGYPMNWMKLLQMMARLCFFVDFQRYSTQWPETVTMMFSMKMTFGLEKTRMGKTDAAAMCALALFSPLPRLRSLHPAGKKTCLGIIDVYKRWT